MLNSVIYIVIGAILTLSSNILLSESSKYQNSKVNPVLNTGRNSYFFIHLSDPQFYFTQMADDITDSCVVQINKLGAAFTIVAGDLGMMGYPSEWTDCKQSLDRLLNPYYVVPGNHDVFPYFSLAQYRDFWGPDYYSFTYDSCLFIALNSPLLEDTQLPDEHAKQDSFLFATLEQSDNYLHKFWFFHYPLYQSSPTEASSDGNVDRPQRDTLLKYLTDYDITAVLTGHTHSNIILNYGCTDLITGFSSCGTPLPAGYRIVKVYENGVESFPVVIYTNSGFEKGIDTVRDEKIVTPTISVENPVAGGADTILADSTVYFNMIIDSISYPGWSNLNYKWEFGDSNTSTARDTSHSYSDIGEYIITARAYNQQSVASYRFKIVVKQICVEESYPISNHQLSISNTTIGDTDNTKLISYYLPSAAFVNLCVYDITGRRVRELYKGQQDKGVHNITVSGLETGIYFVRLTVDKESVSTKITITIKD
ncbi:MAG: metallophosphoesterase [Candidatus Stahlbacteria bacterium]|nr:metallophosphoesterase [Candidatus Stahlbacteria bacterium]